MGNSGGKGPIVGDRVTAIVEQVYPFGVFVRLTDGTKAYIRKRELSLSGDQGT